MSNPQRTKCICGGARTEIVELEARIEELTRALTDRSMELNDRLEGRMETLEADARAALSRAEVAERELEQVARERDRLLLTPGEPGSPWQGIGAECKRWQLRADAAEAALEEARGVLAVFAPGRFNPIDHPGMYPAAQDAQRILSTPSPSRGKAILSVVSAARLLDAELSKQPPALLRHLRSVAGTLLDGMHAALRNLDSQDGGGRCLTRPEIQAFAEQGRPGERALARDLLHVHECMLRSTKQNAEIIASLQAAEAERDALRAENERLREALRVEIEMPMGGGFWECSACGAKWTTGETAPHDACCFLRGQGEGR